MLIELVTDNSDILVIVTLIENILLPEEVKTVHPLSDFRKVIVLMITINIFKSEGSHG